MAALARSLRDLPPDRAQAVALHFFGGLSHKETARAMGRTQIAVKSLLHRALRELRERWNNA
jgi:RNA polymerase sigma-70 factor (ECF subfamily)